MKITNKMIFDEIQELKSHVIETNGKVKLNRMMSKVALCIAIIAFTIVTGINIANIIGVIA